MVDGIMKVNIGGVDVEMLITPRLCVYNGRENVSLSMSDRTQGDKIAEGGFGFSYGADVLYCAALNYWDLTGKDIEDFPLHRIDFHRWAFEHNAEFLKTTAKALEMLGDGSKQKDENSKKKSIRS